MSAHLLSGEIVCHGLYLYYICSGYAERVCVWTEVGKANQSCLDYTYPTISKKSYQ